MTDVLRECLREAESLRGVSEATGVNVATLSLFLRGMSSLRLDKVEEAGDRLLTAGAALISLRSS